MNWVPLLFFDDVCHQLNYEALNQVGQLFGSWSKFGSEHGEKRRELKFRCELNGNQEVRYSLRKTDYSRKVTVADLNLEFDCITAFSCGFALPKDHRVSLREFERVVLPIIAPLVTNCCWPYLSPKRRDQHRFFFNAFKNCPGFNEIYIEEGEESRDFVTRQIELGNVQRLTLYGTKNWPEEEKLTETLKKFVSSMRFHKLYTRDLLRDDYELFELFLERALAKELKPRACIVTAAGNLDKSRFLTLRPEYRRRIKEGCVADYRLKSPNYVVSS